MKLASRSTTSLVRHEEGDTNLIGITCANLVLACIASAALTDEVLQTTPSTGWASIKYGNDEPIPKGHTIYASLVEKLRYDVSPTLLEDAKSLTTTTGEATDIQSMQSPRTPLYGDMTLNHSRHTPLVHLIVDQHGGDAFFKRIEEKLSSSILSLNPKYATAENLFSTLKRSTVWQLQGTIEKSSFNPEMINKERFKAAQKGAN